ncbi:phage tail protein [Solitalea lacus]|uniref:phage tail protein n=1 Tax=Solitalea lacus TaxID=2911172 RepID=UPI001EDC53D8|nr:tail fiber protein [Solitalea lacus]UKJ06772.1 tail fiber protein [Solitalea lacus]
MDEYLAIIKLFAGNFAPRGYAICQGQLLPISQNSALFSVLGTTYGGDGQTTFGLPDLRGRVAVGYGQGRGLSNYVLGEVTGMENVTLTLNNLPAHNHAIIGTVQLPVNVDSSATDSPSGSYPGPTPGNTYNPTPSPGEFAGNLTTNLNTAITGNSIPVSIIQPTLALNYIICTQGVFPSRN